MNSQLHFPMEINNKNNPKLFNISSDFIPMLQFMIINSKLILMHNLNGEIINLTQRIYQYTIPIKL